MENNELIIQAVKERLEKGDFTEIINKHVDEAVNKVVEDLFKKGWNDKDKGELAKGCADCVATIVSILEENGVEIDYNDFDFDYWERKARELL